MKNVKAKTGSYFISHLGCAKNRVDGDIISAILDKSGWSASEKPGKSDVIIINTCGFIQDAKQESIDAILEACELKEKNPKIKIAVTGCLGQRYAEDLLEEIPEIDFIIGLNRIKDIPRILNGAMKDRIYVTTKPIKDFNDDLEFRQTTSGKSYSYLRISEGCSNRCSYCAIPLIRGDFRSRDPDNILKEARHFIDNGVKELILISQDTTLYGHDLASHANLSFLLRSLCSIDGDFWIRLLYCHPAHFSKDIIYTISDEEKILNYIDIPIQHASDRLLTSMGRGYTKADIRRLIKDLRDKLDDVVLRSTAIVGYPGETDENFEELMEFIEEMKFNHLGAFIYSPEEGTKAFEMKDQISLEVKEERLERLMLLQADISDQKNQSFIGKTVKTLIEKGDENDNDEYIGRCYAHAPDVDGHIILANVPSDIKTDTFYYVKITDSDVYDLYGEIVL